MPFVAVGKGAAVSKGLHHYKYALYLGGLTDNTAVIPTDKLSGTADPTGGWVRQARLESDTIKWNISDPELTDGLAGFQKTLQWRVVTKSDFINITLEFDEADPEVMALLQQTVATTITGVSGASGLQFIYKTGNLQFCKVLLIGYDEKNVTQDHIYMGNASIRFKLNETSAGHNGIEAEITAFDVSDTQTFIRNFWN